MEVAKGLNQRRGKKAALASVGLAGLLLIMAAGPAIKEVFLEHRCIRQLDSEDTGEINEATQQLGAMGSVRAIPRLLKLEAARDLSLGLEEALETISRKRPGDTIRALISALGHEDPDVSKQAARNLGEIGPDAAAAIPALSDGLSDPDTFVRVSCAWAIMEVTSDSSLVFPTLVSSLMDPSAQVRYAAIHTLADIGEEARSAIPALVECLKREHDPDNITFLRQALHAMGSDAVGPLSSLLLDGNREARLAAAETLWTFGPEAQGAVPALTLAIQDADEDVRRTAVQALGDVGQGSGAGVRALVKAAEDPVLQWSALTALCGMGAAAHEALPALVSTLEDGNGYLRAGAARALGEIGGGAEAARPALVKAARSDRSVTVKLWAAYALARLKPEGAKGLVQELLPRLQATDWGERDTACEILGTLGPMARDAVPALVTGLEKGKLSLKLAAVALRRIGLDPTEAEPLLKALRDRDVDVKGRVAEILSIIGPGASFAVPELVVALADANPYVRSYCVPALAAMGSRAREAIPALESALRGRPSWVRAEIRRALWKIHDETRE